MEYTSRIEGRVYVDLNGWEQREENEFWISLDSRATIRDLVEMKITLQEGTPLIMWTDDADDEGNFDPLYSEGVAHFHEERLEWVAVIKLSGLRHASDL